MPQFTFVVAKDQREYRTLRNSGASDVVVILPHDQGAWNWSMLAVDEVRVGDLVLELNESVVDGVPTVTATHLRLFEFIGTEAMVSYKYHQRIRKIGHLYVNLIAFPTFNAKIKLELGSADAAIDSVVPFFVNNPGIRVIRSPPLDTGQPTRSVEIEVPGWSLPNSGVVFTWVLRQERTQAFHRLLEQGVR